MAVTETEGSRRFVSAATATAQACGVFAGQSVSTALALLPDLVVVARKFDDERRALIDAALAALRFTPTVSLRRSGLVMEVSASLRLFGGRRAFGKSLAAAMSVQGLGMSTAEAPTPHGAWLLAKQKALRHYQATQAALRQLPGQRSSLVRPNDKAPVVDFDKALGDVPVRLLEALEATAHRMTGIGVRKVADLWCLPTGGLARRFGQEVIEEVARARGTRPDPQSIFAAPDHFEARLELMARVESVEALGFGAERLLEQLAGWLTARRAAVRGFELILHHERWTRDAIAPTTIAIAVATPSNDHRRLLVLVRERFSRLELKAPVLELSIAAPTIVAEQEAHGTLFPAREQAAETLARLLEKLVARLGEESMTRIERANGHRPERAWREVPADLLGAVAVPEARGSRDARAKGTRPASRKRVGSPKVIVDPTADEKRSVPDRVEFAKRACQPQEETPVARRVDEPNTRTDSRAGAIRSESASLGLQPLNIDSSDTALSSRIDEATCDVLRAIGIPVRVRATHPPDESSRRSFTELPTPVESTDKGPLIAGRTLFDPFVRKEGRRPDRPGDPRPAWLLSEPRALTTQRDYPVYESLPLSLLAGPERIETGWWEDATATRDYFIAQNATGHLVWIYRERLLKENRPSWYLQGLFG